MQICWKYRITNQEILNSVGSVNTEAKIIQAHLHWTGHITRRHESRIPRQLYYGELASGSCKKGYPKKSYKDNLKSYIKWAEIQPTQFESSASNRSNWQALVRQGSNNFKEDYFHCLAVVND